MTFAFADSGTIKCGDRAFWVANNAQRVTHRLSADRAAVELLAVAGAGCRSSRWLPPCGRRTSTSSVRAWWLFQFFTPSTARRVGVRPSNFIAALGVTSFFRRLGDHTIAEIPSQ